MQFDRDFITWNKQVVGRIGGSIIWVLWLCALAAVVNGFAIIARQIIFWLQYGVWKPNTVADVLTNWGVLPSPSHYVGWQKIVDWLLSFSGALFYFLLAVIVITFAVHVAHSRSVSTKPETGD
jgi:hypothetical protein